MMLYEQWVTGTYWEKHGISRKSIPPIPSKTELRVQKLASTLLPLEGLAWRTVRDALVDVPDPRQYRSTAFLNHNFQDGARTYPGHTGSPIDLPGKTLKAGDHGVPGGENMVVLDNGDVRYFSVREAARLQTFPDGYVFHGSWTETMRQLGNAVPVALGRRVAASVAESLVMAQCREVARSHARSVA
jgi:DNA (cytosine-5)-methyltransferase 1